MKKKSMVIGIALLFAALLLTCEAGIPENENVEYTDVVYSEDGSRVTVYLDGVGVPITPAQRAMSTRLSKMAYDYLEVIFIAPGSPKTVARAQWELGQSAGISGVARGTAAAGINYKWASTATDAGPVALMAVGRKEGKTLLGIGQIAEVDNSASFPTGTNPPGFTGAAGSWDADDDGGWIAAGDPGEGLPKTILATIFPDTKSVTFYLESVKTGLKVETPTAGVDVATINSFSAANTPPATLPVWVGSTHTKLGNSYIPTYPLSESNHDPVTAHYMLFGAAQTFKGQLVGKKINVEPRFPRYLDNGQYKQLSAAIDMKSTVTASQPVAFDNDITLTLTPLGTGIFSFYIEIPVIVLTAETGTNTGKLSAVPWKIRTGLGSELYSLDDGISGGGCVLITIGKLSLEDWLNIEWEWLP